MLNGLIVFAAVPTAAMLLRKVLPSNWTQALGTAVFWLCAVVAAAFLAMAVWTASGIASGQVFWLVFAAVQIGGAGLSLFTGRVVQRLLAA